MPQQFKHFNIFMVSSPGLYDKKMTLPSRYQLILFSSNLNIFQKQLFYLELSHEVFRL